MEDKNILEDVNKRQLALKLECTPGYISHLSAGRRICSEEFYIELKKAVKEQRKNS
jgi:hypothetical protein